MRGVRRVLLLLGCVLPGIAWGADVRLSLAGSTEYDSNVFRSPTDEKSDVVFRVAPRVGVVEDREKLNYSVGYSLPYEIGVKYKRRQGPEPPGGRELPLPGDPPDRAVREQRLLLRPRPVPTGREPAGPGPGRGGRRPRAGAVEQPRAGRHALLHTAPLRHPPREPGGLRHHPVQPRQRAQLRRHRELGLPAHRASSAGRWLQLLPAELRRDRQPTGERHRLLQSVRFLAVAVRRDDQLRHPGRPGPDPLEPGHPAVDDPQSGTRSRSSRSAALGFRNNDALQVFDFDTCPVVGGNPLLFDNAGNVCAPEDHHDPPGPRSR